MQQRGRGGNSWIGWVIFVLLVFGSRLLPPVAAWLSQATGLPITTPMLIAVAVGLSVVGSVVGSVARSVGKARASSETRLPTMTTLPPPSSTSAPRMSQLPRPSSGANPPPRLPSGQQQLPGPPRFEPIIHPRVLTFGIIGLLVIGGLFLAAVLMLGVLP